MSQPPADSTRAYFQRVMEGWAPRQEAAHPYESNRAWQRAYAALQRWVDANRLAQGRVLEVGSGTGLLQDIVPDYVGVDLAASSAGFMRKPFSVCSATTLPFPDDSFDGAFSIWVLEHIEQPEAMLAEMRRVVRPGGAIFLVAAYDVAPWVSQGLHKRPFSDLSPRQRLTKLSIPLRSAAPYRVAATLARRLPDLLAAARRRPGRLRFSRRTPNFATYWDYDADACVALDAYNVARYFISRGDRPQFRLGPLGGLLLRSGPQSYQVHK